jgi:hypothetical protein
VQLIAPINPLTGEPLVSHVLSGARLNEVLEMRLPGLSDENRGLTTERVVEDLTGRKFLWIPRVPPGAGVSRTTFAEESPPVSGMTVGRYLRSIASGSTEFGYPLVRLYGLDLENQNLSSPATQESRPGLMDAVLLTDRFIVVISLPTQ